MGCRLAALLFLPLMLLAARPAEACSRNFWAFYGSGSVILNDRGERIINDDGVRDQCAMSRRRGEAGAVVSSNSAFRITASSWLPWAMLAH